MVFGLRRSVAADCGSRILLIDRNDNASVSRYRGRPAEETEVRRILYVSVGTAPGAAADLSEILHQSRHNNALDGITGLLWSDGIRFVQAIEGPAASVTATFERIRADPRHHAIVVLQDEMIAARDFGGWTMEHRRASDSADGADAHMARVLVNASDAIRDQFLNLIAASGGAASEAPGSTVTHRES